MFIFKDQIADFFKTLTNPVGTAVEKAGEDVFNAGVESRKAIDSVVLQINRETKTAEIAQAAKDSGFTSIEAFERATDSCSLVVGSSRTMCDVGIIGTPESIIPKGGQTNIGTKTTSIAGRPEGMMITNQTVSRLSNLQKARARRGR